MWTGKKVLVTGAGGFIGSHLAEALVAAGATTTAMVRYNSGGLIGNLALMDHTMRKSLRVVSGNVEDSDFVYDAIKGQDIVFHLAALIAIPYSYEAPRTYVRTNIEGTLNVLEGARRHNVARVLHTSTSEVYGTALRTPIDETHPLQGQSPYSASKSRTYGSDVTGCAHEFSSKLANHASSGVSRCAGSLDLLDRARQAFRF